MTHWNKEDVYDNQISPLMAQIIAICKEHQIPACAVFQYEDSEENGPGFCTTTLPFPNAAEHMQKLCRTAKPAAPVTLAETIVTKPDGSKEITITRVS